MERKSAHFTGNSFQFVCLFARRIFFFFFPELFLLLQMSVKNANALLPRPSHLRACKSCERVGVLCSYNCFVRNPVSPQTPCSCLSPGAWRSETAKCGLPAFAVSDASLRSESVHTARVGCEFRFVLCRSFTSSHSVGLRFSLRIKAARVESGTHFFSRQNIHSFMSHALLETETSTTTTVTPS